jgi:histidinol-phosphatase (PHP family)
MAWTNFHSHTKYCDGTNPAVDYLLEAEKNGLMAYGYSSHAPTPYPSCKWAMKLEDLNQYCSDVNTLKNSSDVEVYLSLEIDYVPNEMGPSSKWVSDANLDYTLGSIHFVDFHQEHEPWEIDGPLSEFEKGLNGIFGGNIKSAVKRYYEITRHMVENDCPQIIGHLDKIKMQNTRKRFFDETEDWYIKEIAETIECIAATDSIVEINTRGLYKKRATDTYPGGVVLDMLKDQNVPIMLNSDGHHPSEIIREFESTAEMLAQQGFKEIWAIKNKEFRPFKFNGKGLISS